LVRIPSSGPAGQADIHDCPAKIGNWEGRPLLRVREESGHYSVFCSYAWVAAEGTEPNRSALAELGDFQWDEPRVAAHGEYADMQQKLAQQSRAQLGAVSWPGTPAPAPVHVAVLDTSANVWSDPDNNPHGKAVGMLAFDTACKDSPNCNVSVDNFLALPLYRDTTGSKAVIRRDRLHGGAFGSHGDLSRAILDAMEAMASAPANAHTILNLSVAYDSAALSARLEPDPTDYQNRVVLEALQYARCQGALVIAAAGNGPVPADPQQTPGFPARWTQARALDANQCQSRFGISQPVASSQPGPLLYAVSGLDFGGSPLLTTRGSGQSALAAVGFAAVRKQPNGAFTRTLTGSSMATAAVSGIAAALWSHAPTLTPDAVMRALYDNSDAIDAAPDFRPFESATSGNTFPDARRITLCSAADAGYASCVERPEPSTTVDPGTLPSMPASTDVQQGTTPASKPDGVSPWELPWLWPQPEGEPGCGACGLVRSNPGLLSIIFRHSFPLGTVSNLRVRVSLPVAVAALARASNDSALADNAIDTPEQLLEVGIPMPLPDPFSVQTDSTVDATAAELTYQIEVDGTPVDATETVLLE
jgi:hypothetical protein